MDYALKALQIKARQQVHTLLSGNSLSALYGESYDFLSLREYQTGDETRKIHWPSSAKLAKPYIKQTQSWHEISVAVVALMDGSLYFAKGNNKQKKLAEIATILGYACEQQGHLFRGICYTQNSYGYTPPTKHLYDINRFSSLLYNASLLHTAIDTDDAIKDLFASLHRPSLVFVLSDFLEDIDLSIIAQKHEVIAIIIRDSKEEHPDTQTETMLTNPKNYDKIKNSLNSKTIAEYLSKLKAHDKNLIGSFVRYNIRHTKIYTQDNSIKKLLLLFG